MFRLREYEGTHNGAVEFISCSLPLVQLHLLLLEPGHPAVIQVSGAIGSVMRCVGSV